MSAKPSKVTAYSLPSLAAIQNAIAGFLISYGFESFCWFFVIEQKWTHAAPRNPLAIMGLTYPHNVHRTVVYFSAFQASVCAIMFFTSIPLCFVGAALMTKKNVQRRLFRISWDVGDPEGVYNWAFLSGALAAPFIILVIGPYLVRYLNSCGFVPSLG
ncbi:MAG: hypothetical protein JO056_11760 [Alphaproteobacteria bacterium]|nr:hypothetical protein [Alphaproteobacteria bacterium]